MEEGREETQGDGERNERGGWREKGKDERRDREDREILERQLPLNLQ